MTINNCPVMTSSVRLLNFPFSGKLFDFLEKISIFAKITQFSGRAEAISWKINPRSCYFWNYFPEKGKIGRKPTSLESVEFLFY